LFVAVGGRILAGGREGNVARATLNPARAVRQERLGRLDAGGVSDATVLRIVNEPYTIRDIDGRTQDVERRFVAVGVVRSGAYIPAH
jgi:predicted amidohydrolase